MKYAELNPEQIFQYSQSIKSPQSKHLSLKTEADEERSESMSAFKKYSLFFSANKRLKTDPSSSAKISLNLNQRKESFVYLQQLPSLNLKTRITKKSNQMMSLQEITNDPHLSGKIHKKRQNKMKKLDIQTAQFQFLSEVLRYEREYLIYCSDKKYKEAEAILIRLFNYTIDLGLIKYYSASIMIIGDYHFEHNNIQEALYYYNEARKIYYDLGYFQQVVHILIRLSKCTIKTKSYEQSIKILKKALQYAWYCKLDNLELDIYDEIGKSYYLMGDTQNGKKFHKKYYSSGLQPNDSAIRLTSKQSLILEGISTKVFDKEINSLVMIKSSAPIKKFNEISQFPSPLSNSLRGQYQRDLKYFMVRKPIKIQIKNILLDDFFEKEIGQMYIHSEDWTTPIRLRKFLSFDIKRNKHLQKLGINYGRYFKNPQNIGIIKSSPDPSGNDIEKWCTNIIKHSKRNYGNQNGINRVQLRGLDKNPQPPLSNYRLIYNLFFDF